VARERKLGDVLNLRVEMPLSREIARYARVQERPESEIARTFLRWGAEVARKLDADTFSKPFEWELPEGEWPTIVEISARRRPMTDEEVDERGLREFVGGYPDEEPWK
jgi:hypothetical protein